MRTFIHLDFYTVAEIGFFCGMFSTTLLGAGVLGIRSATTIAPESLVSASLDRIVQSPAVLQAMGADSFRTSQIQTGVFRAYEYTPGHFGMASSSLLAWKKPKMEVIYQIWGGDEKQAVVCVSASKDWKGTYFFDLISVDLLGAKAPPTILVEGSEKDLEIRNRLRSSVSLNRKYVVL